MQLLLPVPACCSPGRVQGKGHARWPSTCAAALCGCPVCAHPTRLARAPSAQLARSAQLALPQCAGWRLGKTAEGHDCISHEWKVRNFAAGLDLFQRCAWLGWGRGACLAGVRCNSGLQWAARAAVRGLRSACLVVGRSPVAAANVPTLPCSARARPLSAACPQDSGDCRGGGAPPGERCLSASLPLLPPPPPPPPPQQQQQLVQRVCSVCMLHSCCPYATHPTHPCQPAPTHPRRQDLHLTGFNTVVAEMTTHAAKGLTENDFIMAAKVRLLCSQLFFRVWQCQGVGLVERGVIVAAKWVGSECARGASAQRGVASPIQRRGGGAVGPARHALLARPPPVLSSPPTHPRPSPSLVFHNFFLRPTC